MTCRSEFAGPPHRHALRHAAARRLAGVPKPVRTPPGWLMCLARDAGMPAAFGSPPLDSAAARLAVFRAHHAATVRTVSPLARDLLRHLGLDLDAATRRLGPDGRWSRWLCDPRPLLARRFPHRWKGSPAPAPSEAHDRIAFLHGGVRLDDPGDAVGPLGVRLSRMGPEVAARLGPVSLRTFGGLALLVTSAAVPEIIRAACVGRDVGTVFGHVCLAGRGYRIVAQSDLPPCRAGAAARWCVMVATGVVAWRVPWARDAFDGAGLV